MLDGLSFSCMVEQAVLLARPRPARRPVQRSRLITVSATTQIRGNSKKLRGLARSRAARSVRRRREEPGDQRRADGVGTDPAIPAR